MSILTVVVHGANLGYGVWRLSQHQALQAGPRVLVIQTNLPQDNKIGRPLEDQKRDVAKFLTQTREAFDQIDGQCDLIVWPETMLPIHGFELDTVQTLIRWRQDDELAFAQNVSAMSHELATPMLVGAPCYRGLDVKDGQWIWRENYNSAYLIQDEPRYQRYDKYLLTPFGETMPYISAWPWLEDKLLSIGAQGMSFSLDSSDDLNLLNLNWQSGRPIRLGTPICFEDTISRVCRRMARRGLEKRVDIFVNLSNDGWFSRFDEGRQQHLQAARFRCIENRIPMIRAVNTGMSVLIDSTGKVAAKIGDGRYGVGQERGSVLADVRLDARRSPYGLIGDAWAWLCLIGMLLITGFSFRKFTNKE